MSSSASPARHYGLDLLRVIATYMVIQIHTGEFYYIGAGGTVLATADAQWVGWFNSLFRMCVPLFVMISGYFLFPVGEPATFFKRRFSRVAVPFVLWCVLYAVYALLRGQSDAATTLRNIANIPVNYGTEVGHLWFVYMLMGIYLIAPILSPWIQSASRRMLEFYLALWALSLALPYLHLVAPSWWGECYWNRTPMLHYFSGFLGYAVAGAYFRRFHSEPRSRDLGVGFALVALGFAVTTGGFLQRLGTETQVSSLELTWGFETINVALMTVGAFLLFKNVGARTSTAPGNLVPELSALSYGMYLAHIMVLNTAHALLAPRLGSAAGAIPLIALTTFVGTYAGVKALSLVPGAQWLLGMRPRRT